MKNRQIKIINRFFKRTEMYIGDRSYDSVAAFLVGLFIGFGETTLIDFSRWLTKEYGAPSNHSFYQQVIYLFTDGYKERIIEEDLIFFLEQKVREFILNNYKDNSVDGS